MQPTVGVVQYEQSCFEVYSTS